MTNIKLNSENSDIYIYISDESINELEGKIKLSEDEQNYYNTIRAEVRRREWITSRIGIREILGENVSSNYINRKPYLVGSSHELSISHSDNLVVVMISDNPCGVDIENTTRNFERVKSRFLNPIELDFISGDDLPLAWSIKEAAYKLIGVSDIDFGTMFIITNIDKEKNVAILRYNNIDYTFKFEKYNHYNIVYSI